MVTYTSVDSKGYQRIVNIPLYKAISKGYNFIENDIEYYIYESDKEKVILKLN